LALVTIRKSGPWRKVQNLRRCGDLILAEPQHPHFGIGEDAQTFRLGPAQFGRFAFAGIDVFAHAQKGEVVVAQPGDEGQRLLARRFGLFVDIQRHQIRSCVVDHRQHRFPVRNRGLDLIENMANPCAQLLARGGAKPWHVDLDMADTVFGLAAVAMGKQHCGRLAVHDQDRVQAMKMSRT
jgi:hypothetical protein